MATRTIHLAIAEEDLSRLDRLADRFSNGSRSAFLREAMRQMEVVERASRLVELQAYGTRRAAAAGLDDDPVTVVRRALTTCT